VNATMWPLCEKLTEHREVLGHRSAVAGPSPVIGGGGASAKLRGKHLNI